MDIADWVVKIIVHRLRGLGASQIQDLIRHSDELETLSILESHLLSGNFKYWHHMSNVKEQLLDEIYKRLDEIAGGVL